MSALSSSCSRPHALRRPAEDSTAGRSRHGALLAFVCWLAAGPAGCGRARRLLLVAGASKQGASGRALPPNPRPVLGQVVPP